ncbi:MAG TPA: PQQ-dependent sugar dehydrogenase [Blastocatellia bacterium]|nr:PQQ-dependent sugar dehydrogenase [Blastocatellia bacterium]
MTKSIVAFFGLVLTLPVFPLSQTRAAGVRTQTGAGQIELEPVLSGLASPVYLTSAHDTSSRLFIVEQGGRIKVLRPGDAAPAIFLDISGRVLAGGERGLLGLAFHPQFQSNRRFFVDYTRATDGATVIAEYQASSVDPNIAQTDEKVLLLIPQPFANHNGGMIEFGPDGFLYVGMGDGGSANDPGNRAQDINNLLGKILRIDVDHADGGVPYSSPSNNPFFGSIPGRDEIFAIGMRNPWRFSFDRLTGELYVGDVGQNAWEEIDIVTVGSNLGWRVMEATHCNPAIGGGACNSAGLTLPVAEYSHSGGRCSVTGGYVYRGQQATFAPGTYLYADFCTGEIFTMINGQQSVLLATDLNVSSFGEDEAGEIYVVGLGGTIHRFVNTSATEPFTLISAVVVRRSTGSVLNPITIQRNGKRFDIVVAVNRSDRAGATVLINGRKMKNTTATDLDADRPTLTAGLRRGTLSEPGPLVIEVLARDGSRSNPIVLQAIGEN